jgi:choline dehydrogenase-like flavoprotein
MFVDARSLPADTRLEADVCIVGAGAAGITLARALAGRGREVLLVESGGLVPDLETQSLYAGESVGQPYFPLEACRLRFFGGTTNHWAGYARPLDRFDFEERPWIPESGWPFDADELAPYYAAAVPVLELAPGRYDAAFWSQASGLPTLPLAPEVFESRVFLRSPPTRFGTAYRADLERAASLRVLLHANAVGIETEEDGAFVGALAIATLTGLRLRVRARHVVLAAGGIENARLLLASRPSGHPRGVGNAHDLVGRFFMEHPHLISAFFLPADPGEEAAFYRTQRTEEGRFEGTLNLHEGVLRRERLGAVSITLVPAPRRDARDLEAETAPGMASLRYLLRTLRRRELPEDLGRHVGRVLRDLDRVARAAWGRRLEDGAPGTMHKVFFRAEQVPNPESRVTLAEARDALGMPRTRLAWRLTELDLRTLRRGHELLAREVGRAGLGRLFVPPDDPDRSWTRDLFGGNHHMGTTRMHPDPRRGVVDAHGRVHGVTNLWVAGSSVFPTSGYANPTLTIVALALRLADRLQAALG